MPGRVLAVVFFARVVPASRDSPWCRVYTFGFEEGVSSFVVLRDWIPIRTIRSGRRPGCERPLKGLLRSQEPV